MWFFLRLSCRSSKKKSISHRKNLFDRKRSKKFFVQFRSFSMENDRKIGFFLYFFFLSIIFRSYYCLDHFSLYNHIFRWFRSCFRWEKCMRTSCPRVWYWNIFGHFRSISMVSLFSINFRSLFDGDSMGFCFRWWPKVTEKKRS